MEDLKSVVTPTVPDSARQCPTVPGQCLIVPDSFTVLDSARRTQHDSINKYQNTKPKTQCNYSAK